MHAPHGPLAPKGWKRSARGNLWRELRDGRTLVLLPPSGWRLGIYGAGGRRDFIDVEGVLPSERELAAAASGRAPTRRAAAAGPGSVMVERHEPRRGPAEGSCMSDPEAKS